MRIGLPLIFFILFLGYVIIYKFFDILQTYARKKFRNRAGTSFESKSELEIGGRPVDSPPPQKDKESSRTTPPPQEDLPSDTQHIAKKKRAMFQVRMEGES